MTLGELVERLGGKLVQGSADTAITGVNSTVQAEAEMWCSRRMKPRRPMH